MLDSLIVEDGPPNSINPGSAVGAITSFDADVGCGGRPDEVSKTIGDTSCSTHINQDVKGVRVKKSSMCCSLSGVGTVGLGASNAHGDCQENDSCGMVAWPGPLAPREGSSRVTVGSSKRSAMTATFGSDMDVGCYEGSKVIKGGVGELEPRLEPLRTSRELALGNIRIGQGATDSHNDDPGHCLGIEEDCREFLGPERMELGDEGGEQQKPGPERMELGDEGREQQKGWPAEKREEQGMKSFLANLSVAIKIPILILILTLFSKEGSSSNACFLEWLFGIGVLGDHIIGRVLAAFCSGVANPLLGVMLTRQMVSFAIHNLDDRFSFLGKDLLPSPFLLPLLLCFAGIFRRSVFVLLRRGLGKSKLADLSCES
jgi:hypothetical protein